MSRPDPFKTKSITDKDKDYHVNHREQRKLYGSRNRQAQQIGRDQS